MSAAAGRLIGGRKRAVTADTAAGRKSLLNRRVLPALGRYSLAEITPMMVNNDRSLLARSVFRAIQSFSRISLRNSFISHLGCGKHILKTEI